MSERLLQLAEARRKLGTKVPWIADTIADAMRIGLRSGSNSIYLISPEGKIVWAADKMDRDGLRAALAKVAGPIEIPTPVSALRLPALAKQSRATNEETALTVSRPEGMTILSITPVKPEDTYYVKLRAEADPALLETGTGRLFLGFYPDPILDAHWNNLTQPMKYELKLPPGMKASPAQATAGKGPGDSDTQPRQFWVDVKGGRSKGDLTLTLHYFGCTSEMCEAMTHEYTIRLTPENRGANTYGFNRGPGGGKGGKAKN